MLVLIIIPVPLLLRLKISNSVSSQEGAVALTQSLTSQCSSIFSTEKVWIKDAWGNYQVIRVLTHGGSQLNVITQRCEKRFNLRVPKISQPIFGLDQKCFEASSGITYAVYPVHQKDASLTVNAVVLTKICSDLPSPFLSLGDLKYISPLTHNLRFRNQLMCFWVQIYLR